MGKNVTEVKVELGEKNLLFASNEFIVDRTRFLVSLFLKAKDMDKTTVLIEEVNIDGKEDQLRLAVSYDGEHLYTSCFYPRELVAAMFGCTTSIIVEGKDYTETAEDVVAYSTIFTSLMEFVAKAHALVDGTPPPLMSFVKTTIVEKLFNKMYSLWLNAYEKGQVNG